MTDDPLDGRKCMAGDAVASMCGTCGACFTVTDIPEHACAPRFPGMAAPDLFQPDPSKRPTFADGWPRRQ